MDTDRKPMAIPNSTAKIQPGMPATTAVSAYPEASTPQATRCFTWMPSASVDGVTPPTPHTPPHYHPGMPPVLVRRTLQNVKVTLENAELWNKFHRIGTEMIITKTGRRMFPALQISVSGLDPDAEYYFLLELTPVTSEIPSSGTRPREVTSVGDCMGSSRPSLVHRLRFSGREWVVAGRGEAQAPTSSRIYVHPDSPAPGSRWMKGLGRRHVQKDSQSSSPGCEQADEPQEQTRSSRKHTISFSKVKLTNNSLDGRGHVVLTSMHKYIPRIHIVKASDYMSLSWGPEAVFSFPETEFVAVTAYQNGKITKLKIDHNPFAKGFRETGMSKSKRKLEQMLGKDGDEDIHSTDEEELSNSPCTDCNNNGEQGSRRRHRPNSVQSVSAESGPSRSPPSSPEGSNISGSSALDESIEKQSTYSRISYDSLSGYFPFLWASFAQQQMANYDHYLPPHLSPRYNLENSISDLAQRHFLPYQHPSLMVPSMWKIPPLHPIPVNYDFFASHGTGSVPYFPHTQYPYVSTSPYQPSKLPTHLEPPYLLDLSSKHT